MSGNKIACSSSLEVVLLGRISSWLGHRTCPEIWLPGHCLLLNNNWVWPAGSVRDGRAPQAAGRFKTFFVLGRFILFLGISSMESL